MDTMADFFAKRGLGYCTHERSYEASNVFGAVASSGGHGLVMARVGLYPKTMRFFWGYYENEQLEEVAKRISRVRKYSFVDVMVVRDAGRV